MAAASPPTPSALLPTIIDIEASGFGRGSYPIEVGFVTAQGAAVCTLIRPDDGWTHWDPDAERLHGITRDMLCLHGRPVRAVAALLNEQLAGQLVYSDNWAHDYAWLAILFEAAGCAARFRLHHLRELLDEGALGRWDGARALSQAALAAPRHRASHDARVLQMTYARACSLGAPPA